MKEIEGLNLNRLVERKWSLMFSSTQQMFHIAESNSEDGMENNGYYILGYGDTAEEVSEMHDRILKVYGITEKFRKKSEKVGL